MTAEQTPKSPRFNWSKEFDPDEEIVEPHTLYKKILKPVRLNKPGRDLVYRSPTSADIINQFGELPRNYFMRVPGLGWAGNHCHEKKVEIFCPEVSSPLIVFLQHRMTGEKDVIVLKDNERDTYVEYLILPNVAHFIINPSEIPEKVPYTVLSNMTEKEALKTGDVIHFPIDASIFPFPPDIQLTPQLKSLLESSKSLK